MGRSADQPRHHRAGERCYLLLTDELTTLRAENWFLLDQAEGRNWRRSVFQARTAAAGLMPAQHQQRLNGYHAAGEAYQS